jgi:diadenosine tetraphosphate (Ap4A) HIT family hydrolase
MPISPGHILLTTRKHYRKLSDLQPAPRTNGTWSSRREAQEARDAARALGEVGGTVEHEAPQMCEGSELTVMAALVVTDHQPSVV